MAKRKMRIAVIDHRANVGGGRRFTSSLVKALTELSTYCSIRFITTRESLDMSSFGDLDSLNLDTYALVTEETTRRWLPPGRSLGIPGTWKLKEAARTALLTGIFRIDTQVEHAVKDLDVAYFAWPYFLPYRDFGIPVVSTLHDLIWKDIGSSNGTDNATLDEYMPQWLKNSAAIVTSTNFMRGEIEKFYPLQAKRIQVVHLPVPELPPPLPQADQGALLARWNIRQPYALCVAGLWAHKNHRNLIRAVTRLKQRGVNTLLVCAGPYTDQAFDANFTHDLWKPAQELRQLALDLGIALGRDVIGLGHVSDVELATLYSGSSCVVMPVTNEAGSFPILEAAAQGVPVACSEIPVYQEQADVYGLRPVFFDPGQPESIADAIEQIMNNRRRTAELQDTAHRVRARTWHDAALEYLQVFQSVVL